VKSALNRLLLVAAAGASASSYARTFDCDVPGDRFGFMIIDSDAHGFELRYGRFDSQILEIRLPTDLLQELPGGRLVFDTGPTAPFPIGESIAQAFGHIDADGKALIDLYNFGVGRDLSVTLIDSTCTELGVQP
jgi:hypothetical protein